MKNFSKKNSIVIISLTLVACSPQNPSQLLQEIPKGNTRIVTEIENAEIDGKEVGRVALPAAIFISEYSSNFYFALQGMPNYVDDVVYTTLSNKNAGRVLLDEGNMYDNLDNIYTVFVPPSDNQNSLPKGLISVAMGQLWNTGLVSSDQDVMEAKYFLDSYISDGVVDYQSIGDGVNIRTINSTELSISVNQENFSVKNIKTGISANIIDYKYSANGIIYKIDSLLN